MARLQGNMPATKIETAKVPPISHPPKPKFLLRWHASAWQIMAGCLVPRLGELQKKPGTNRVDPKTGRMGQAIAWQAERGWTCIPEDVRGPGTSYLRSYATSAGPDTYWATEWTMVYAGSPAIACDTEGYVEFLQWLVAEGHVPPAPPHVISAMRAKLTAELKDAANKSLSQPAFREEADRLRACLEVLDDAESGAAKVPSASSRLAAERAEIEAERAELAAERARLEDVAAAAQDSSVPEPEPEPRKTKK